MTPLHAPGLAAIACYGAIACYSFLTSLLGALHLPANSDWVPYATGAGLLRSPGLYTLAAQAQYVQGTLHLRPGDGVNPFSAPPVAGFLFLPFAVAGPQLGIIAFALLTCAALTTATALALSATPTDGPIHSRIALVVLTVWCIPGLLNVTQWDALLLVAALLAWRLHTAERDAPAGLLLAVFLLKPQLFWLCPALLLFTRSWRLVLWVSVGTAALLAASAVISGPASIPQWVHLALTANAAFDARSIGLPSLAAVIGGDGAALAAALVAGVAACAGMALLRRRLAVHRDAIVPLGLALSMLCAPHVFANDLLLLTPAVLWVSRRNPAPALVVASGFSVCTLVANNGYPAALHVLPACVALLTGTMVLMVAGLVTARPVALRSGAAGA